MIDNMNNRARRAAHAELDERAQQALRSLESTEPVETDDIQAAWSFEAESRLVQVKRGEAVLVSAAEMFKTLEDQFR